MTPAHFEYDDDGNRLLERNGDSERHMTYDAAGRLSTVLDVQTGRTITYTYDAAGNRASMRVTPDNETTAYAWDSRGLLSRMTDPEGGVYRFVHDALGRRTHTSYPNGMTLDNTYDAASRILSMVYRKPNREVIESFTYTYDARGNRTSKIFANGTAELYGYDDLSRLVSAVYPDGRSVQYIYDAVGNRLEMVEGTAADPLSSSCPNDADCDGVLNAADNCPQTANSSQTDSDRVSTPAGLAAGYNFDENGSSAQSVQDVTGRNPGEALLLGRTIGQFGNALQFVSTTSSLPAPAVKIPNSPSLNLTSSAITVAGWVKPAATTTIPLVNKAGVFSVGINAVFNQPRATLTAADSDGIHRKSSVGTIPFDQWSHVAFVYDGLRLRMYINGQLDSDHNQGVTMPVRDVPVFIGCSSGGPTAPGTACFGRGFQGGLDALGIWSRPLTQAEIAASMGGPMFSGDGRGDACDACPSNPDGTCAPQTCLDRDRDGFGVLGASACTAGQPQAVDCNDGNPNARPGGIEACDGIDNDCDGRVDEACLANPQRTHYTYNTFNQLLASGPGRVCAGDADCDGHLDAADNCPAVSNATQANADGNTPHAAATGSTVWWRFEETSGTTAQDVLGVRPGTLFAGATRTANGRFGRGLTFDGSASAFVRETTATAGPAQPHSIAAWVRYTRASENFGFNSIAGVGNQTAGIYRFQGLLDYPSVVRGGAIPVNEWTHVAYTWDGTNSRLYVNGTQTAISTTPPRSGTGFNVGLMPGNSAWLGDIDEPGLWNRALSAAELQAHAQSAPIGDPEGDACDACATNPDAACRPAMCTDGDGDGYGPVGASNCSGGQPAKFDCNDANAGVYPQVGRDVCDNADNDCDGQVDEECPTGTTYEYDGNGNRSQMSGPGRLVESLFDSRDRLVEVKVDSNLAARYGYNARGLRVHVVDDQGERRALLNGIEEVRVYGQQTQVTRYDHDPMAIDGLMSQVDAAGKSYFLTDALGSAYGLLDGDQAPAGSYRYDVYGRRTTQLELHPTGPGFTGRPHESFGFTYHRSRYYDPETALFVSRDARGVSESLSGDNTAVRFQHPYGYGPTAGSGENLPPTMGTDPLGLFLINHHQSITVLALIDLQWPDSTGRLREVAWRSSLIREINHEHYWIDTVHQPQNRFHAMRDGKETRSQARARWMAHLQYNLDRAVKSACNSGLAANSETVEGLAHLFHAVQDAVAHPFFPTWGEHYRGEPDMGESDKNPTMHDYMEAVNATKNWALSFMEKLRQPAFNSLFGHY